MSVAAVVLAAGEASRYGSPKQRILLPAVLGRLAETSVDEVVVVEGAYPLGALPNEELPNDTVSQGVRVVRCTEWDRGPGASLRCGLASLGDEVEAAVVVLADGPHLSPQAVERVVDMWRRDGQIVAASHGGERGHPLVLGRADWPDIPDEGLRGRPLRLVPCDDLGAPGDVDTPDDCAKL
jgi:CTP:molybdopterin cytidylyltransferase MocA